MSKLLFCSQELRNSDPWKRALDSNDHDDVAFLVLLHNQKLFQSQVLWLSMEYVDSTAESVLVVQDFSGKFSILGVVRGLQHLNSLPPMVVVDLGMAQGVKLPMELETALKAEILAAGLDDHSYAAVLASKTVLELGHHHGQAIPLLSLDDANARRVVFWGFAVHLRCAGFVSCLEGSVLSSGEAFPDFQCSHDVQGAVAALQVSQGSLLLA